MSSRIQGDIQSTNFFIYKNEKYYINLDLFRIFSKKIQKSHFIANTEEIHIFNIIDEDFDVSKESLIDFVIQRQNDEILHKCKNELENLSQKVDKLESENQNLKKGLFELQDKVQGLTKIISQQKQLIDDFRIAKTSCRFTNYSNPNGAIAFLGQSVDIKSGGKVPKSYPIDNIRKFDDSIFYNFENDYGLCKSLNDSFILFDFGENIKIHLTSFFET